jgi:MarR family transcriptional regulator, temperature-dependent positive regulator of motility
MTRETVDFELVDMVGYLIRVSQQVHYTLWSSSTEVSGLTSPQFAVLHALAHEQPLDQTRLGERTSLDRSTLANIVTRLSKRGFVARTRDELDARRNMVVMTDAGRKAHDVAARGAYEINEKLLELVPEGDRKALVRILGALISHHRGESEKI